MLPAEQAVARSKRGAVTAGLSIRHVGLIACCCATAGIPAAMIVSTPGIFYPVVADELGVQTAEISAWMSVAMLSSALFSPLMGNVIGRVNLRPLALSCVIAAAIAMLAFSVATASWLFWLAGVAAGYSLVGCLSLVPAILVNRWFARHVGFLLGLYTAFTGIGGVVFLLVGQAAIDAVGWRATYQLFAVITLVVCVPLVLAFARETPESCGLLPYGAHAGAGAQPASPDMVSESDRASIRLEVRAAYRTALFWAVIAFGFLINLVCQTNGYFPKYVNWVNEQAAAGLVPMAFLAGAVLSSFAQAGNALGKIGLGAYSDFSVRQAIVLLVGAGMGGTLLVWQLPATPGLAVGGLVFGFFLAGVLVLVPMVVRYLYGSGPVYPLLYSRVSVAPTLGGAVGNIVWPWMADNLGGFDAVFATALACMAVILAIGLVVCRNR